MNHNHTAKAAAEFRELERLYPDTQICALCLGHGLFVMNNFKEALPELQKAAQLDPADPRPHADLGANP
jgi:Flp pilus assembly protein TadD